MAGAEGFVRFGAVCAMVGGALRIATALLPPIAQSPALEALYALIDLCLLFGLLGVGAASADRLGRVGSITFIVAVAGLASIVGPDAQLAGVDLYAAGGAVFLLGLSGLAVRLLQRRSFVAPAAFWMAGAASLALAIAFANALAFVVGGIGLGAGFIAAGAHLWRRREQSALSPVGLAAGQERDS